MTDIIQQLLASLNDAITTKIDEANSAAAATQSELDRIKSGLRMIAGTAYERAARGDLRRRRRGEPKTFTEIFDTIRYRLALTSRLSAVATKLVIARPNERPHHADWRKRASQVAALLASSLTIFGATVHSTPQECGGAGGVQTDPRKEQ